MARLIQRMPHDGRLRHVRDHSYIEWRFRNPFREYRFLYAGDPELDGYLVLKRSIDCHEPSRGVSVVDLEAINGSTQAALLKTAVQSFDALLWNESAGYYNCFYRTPDAAPVSTANSAFIVRWSSFNLGIQVSLQAFVFLDSHTMVPQHWADEV